MKKLAIVSTHPIQYNAPLFKLLAGVDGLELKVFYTWGESVLKDKFDPGFGKTVQWDIPLLEGYQFEFAENTSKEKGTHHFFGIRTPKLVEQINAFNPDVVLVYGWAFQSHLKVIRYFSGKRELWFRGDSTLLDEKPGFSVKKMLRSIWLKWVYSHLDKALYVGQSNKEYFEKYGVIAEKLAFVPHSVNDQWFSEKCNNDSVKTKDLRDRLGILPSAHVFLFIGKLEPKKDPLLLLNAFIHLKEENTHLVFVGTGILEELLRESARKSSKSKQIHFLGFVNQSDMPMIYGASSFLVLPSKGPGETWGLVINEALACGTPAIMSNKVGSSKDLAVNDDCVFRSGNQQELKDRMLKLLNLSERDKQKMLIGVSRLNEAFSMKQTEQSIIKLLFPGRLN